MDAIFELDSSPFPGRGGDVLTVLPADPKPGSGGAVRDEPPETSSAKRRRMDIYGTAEPTSKYAELEHAKVAYNLAVDGDSSEDVCTDLHWRIMSLRAMIRSASRASRLAPLSAPGSEAAPEDPDACRLFIGGLPRGITDSELHGLVQQINLANDLTECKVVSEKGVGFLRFSTWDQAQEALDALDNRTVNGWANPLRVKWAVPKQGDAPSQSQAPWRERASGFADLGASETDSQRLFVGQITRGARHPDVEGIFAPYGRIEEFRYLEDKGVAYVTFSSRAAANRAVKELQGAHVSGVSRGEGLNVQFAKPHSR